MFVLSAPFWKHRKPRSRKKCHDKQIMALDLKPNIKLRGIRHLTMLHGGKHQGIKLLNIKLLGLMHLGSRYLSNSGLSSDLYQSIIVAPQRPNLRRWKKINTTVRHLSRCRAWWSGWVSKWSLANNHPQEGKFGSRRTVTPWGATDAPSGYRCSCLGFGS